MGVFGSAGAIYGVRSSIDGRPPELLPASDASSAIAGAKDTNPRAIWASINDCLWPDTGATTTNQFFASRVKTRIAGGQWLAIAPVFCGSYMTSQRCPFGTNITAPVTLSFVLEMASGTLTTSYLSPNTGGTLFQGTFNGSVDGIIRPGDVVVGDWIYPADVGLNVFEFNDRALLPWLRVAWSKTNAADNLGAQNWTEYNAPFNSHVGVCTSYANAKTLITTSGISSYNSGNNFWGASDSDRIPTCIGFIGIPANGQKAVFFDGTSIMSADQLSGFKQGGVDPANNTIKNYDFSGVPAQWAQDITRSIPTLVCGLGSSAMWRVFSDNATDGSWSTAESITRQRANWARFARWFDVFIAKDVHNDSSATGTYASILQTFTNTIKALNPHIKVYGVRVPNGYVDIAGSTVAYSSSLDVMWSAQDAMVAAGYWDGMLTIRENGDSKFPDTGVQVSSTTTSGGSTTTLNDSGATWLTNQWVGSWVNVGGTKKLITANSRTQLTFDAFGGAVGSATAYGIEGNTSADGVHPNQYGARYLASKFDTAIQAVFPIPKFTRTA